MTYYSSFNPQRSTAAFSSLVTQTGPMLGLVYGACGDLGNAVVSFHSAGGGAVGRGKP